MAKSRYDEIHDKYHKILTTKQGTRYEILAAFLFKKLEEDNVVIHDIKLRGDSGVEHQIDVTIEDQAGNQRQILVECKDYDVSGEKVGLEIVRRFSAVVDDSSPDEAFIVTCNGFTRDAQKFAKHKGIKLVILREFKESDWDGRIKEIHLNINFVITSDPTIGLMLATAEGIKKHQDDLRAAGIVTGVGRSDPVYFNFAEKRVQFNEFIQSKMSEVPTDEARSHELRVPLADTTLEVEQRGGVPINGITIKFSVIHMPQTMVIDASKKVAELITEGLGDKGLIVFGDDIRRFSIDPDTGEAK